MISLNRVIIAGNLTRDPELKVTPSNRKFTKMTVALNDFWKDKDGETLKKVSYINIIVWGNLAENCVKFLSKGRNVMFEGRLESDIYTDKNGIKHYATQINASNVVFVENGKRNTGINNATDSKTETDISEENPDSNVNFVEESLTTPTITKKKTLTPHKKLSKEKAQEASEFPAIM